MKRLYYAFLALLALPSIRRHPKWEEADTLELQRFLEKTSTGAKLKAILLNAALDENSKAVRQSPQLTYNAGHANGFTAAVVLLQSLAMTRPTEESGSDSPDTLDHLSP